MLALLLDPANWVALVGLSALEIVLGVDNLVFVSIAVRALPPAQRSSARRAGLVLAGVMRILLLLALVHLVRMDDRRAGLFQVFGDVISVRDLVLIGGGIFLIVKGLMEIRHALTGRAPGSAPRRPHASFAAVLARIALVDIVLSLDSVITAVGLVNVLPVMVAAIVLAVLVMIFVADAVGEFIAGNPTIKMLALVFIVAIGVALFCDGFSIPFPRGYLYFAIGFSVVVEALNLLARRARRPRL
ncbi:TerC family protein [Dokdonella sp.]|uniref:TerC family protein n=1 Tax=Dokdonella sp. TaxID=2291710 RepID=UPI0031CA2E42|nr:TerC family protein [Dokdonella sp.]